MLQFMLRDLKELQNHTDMDHSKFMKLTKLNRNIQ